MNYREKEFAKLFEKNTILLTEKYTEWKNRSLGPKPRNTGDNSEDNLKKRLNLIEEISNILEQLNQVAYKAVPKSIMDDLKERAKKTQEELLAIILEFYKQNLGEWFGAKKLSNEIGLMEGHQYYFADNMLRVLEKKGELEKCPEKKKGYKYKKR